MKEFVTEVTKGGRMKRRIKFIVEAYKWFDKVNGNTYHSCRITRCSDGAVLLCPFRYGYGDQYRWTARDAMAKAKWLPVKYRGSSDYGHPYHPRYECENNYPIYWMVHHTTKKECKALGEEG